MVVRRSFVFSVFAAAMMLAPPVTHAHGDTPRSGEAKEFDASQAEQMDFGRAGEPGKVGRAITVRMGDHMRFSPDLIEVRKGETVRLIVVNDGAAKHELVLGKKKDLEAHAELMRRFPKMVHDEPHMAHVKPGNAEKLVWHFNRAGTFYFACLEPGHYEAGMLGKVIVR